MRIPLATYRLQFSPTFGFEDARQLLDYLKQLGISDVYASPIFKAVPGSSHGYDVVDPCQTNPELGGRRTLDQCARDLKRLGMGWLQDIVPNHSAFDGQNRMLMDILENGRSSPFVHYFDIEWAEADDDRQPKLLAPFLGAFYAECLEKGEIQLKYDRDGFSIRYCELKFPVFIESYVTILSCDLAGLRRRHGNDDPGVLQFLGALFVLKNLPATSDRRERVEQIQFVKRTLWDLYRHQQSIRQYIDACMVSINGEKGRPESFDRLDHLLGDQVFRLSFWKVATEEIDYRRFFNINGLISIRVEDEGVFRDTHALTLTLLKEGKITGIRVDHVDGLYDPTQYLSRLRECAGDVYLVVEKILEPAETLPTFWPVQGSTGYDFLNALNGVFCRQQNRRAFDRLYAKFTGFVTHYDQLLNDKKRLIIGKHMAGDVDRLARLMKKITQKDRYGRDITLYGLRRALVEVLSTFPVYRTYVSSGDFRNEDRNTILTAVDRAKETNPGLAYELNFIQRSLLLESRDGAPIDHGDEWVHFIMRFQQLTGPLMAKGFEDTVLYIYNRLVSLNEVGGDPHQFGVSLDAFHAFQQARAGQWPHSMNATSTHDTKRGEDVRARLNVLSEIPDEWARQVSGWSTLNRSKKKSLKGKEVPTRNDEYFLYQTLLGAFPFSLDNMPVFLDRMKEYVVKAVREAKVHTAWLKPDSDYEDAYLSFIEQIMTPTGENRFLEAFHPFQQKIAHYGILNSLSQALIKIASPGVPDFYQGTELWELHLVDPDNRRAVDFEKRRTWLGQLADLTQRDGIGAIRELLGAREDGRIKLFLILRALKARTTHSDLFQLGDYLPLKAGGAHRNHVIAFTRRHGSEWAMAIAPRFMVALVKEGQFPLGRKVWSDTHLVLSGLDGESARDVITGQAVDISKTLLIGDVLKHFPVALLVGQ